MDIWYREQFKEKSKDVNSVTCKVCGKESSDFSDWFFCVTNNMWISSDR